MVPLTKHRSSDGHAAVVHNINREDDECYHQTNPKIFCRCECLCHFGGHDVLNVNKYKTCSSSALWAALGRFTKLQAGTKPIRGIYERVCRGQQQQSKPNNTPCLNSFGL